LGLIRARTRVEIEWLKALAAEPGVAELQPFSPGTLDALDSAASAFSEADGAAVKAIEATTNHDVKAVEYWLQRHFADNAEVTAAAGFLHFACTSEDINNLSYALMLRAGRDEVILPQLERVIAVLRSMAHQFAELPMLCRTHGQSATPSTLGKEMANVVYRLQRARTAIASVAILGKINGAVGNYNAHLAAYPEVDWEAFAQRFVESLGRLMQDFAPHPVGHLHHRVRQQHQNGEHQQGVGVAAVDHASIGFEHVERGCQRQQVHDHAVADGFVEVVAQIAQGVAEVFGGRQSRGAVHGAFTATGRASSW
jgi:hypothetical protein